MHLVKKLKQNDRGIRVEFCSEKPTKYLYLVEPILGFGIYVNGTILYREQCIVIFHTKTCSEIKT
jgi:hypothetical protein